MSGIIEGYNYDVFISYRQKDNKHDGWVSEFVENLKGELESTFKEDVSVYFDINPHDGLLETHDVDESLKEKLKCLVFIPIISRTYCDPKSFAWEHEFKAFIEQASKDQYGLKVKLPGGNVTSRVLPVQIHDLDAEDKKLVEAELGGHLRGIEFTYKEPGVNRPLTLNDDEKKNLNKSLYKNQVNKVANAVKEIISSLRKTDQRPEEASKEGLGIKSGNKTALRPKVIMLSGLAIVIIVLGILFIPKLIKPKEQVEKSIAVLPFESLSNDPEKQYEADGMMAAITLHLSRIKDLRVLEINAAKQYRKTDKTYAAIAEELGVNYLLGASFQKIGDSVRLIVHLYEKGVEDIKWVEDYVRLWKNIFSMQSEVAQSIATKLDVIITPQEKQLIDKVPTSDLTAYDLTLQSEKYYVMFLMTMDRNNLNKALQLIKTAIQLDPGFALAYDWLGRCSLSDRIIYGRPKPFYLDTALYFFNMALKLDPNLPEAYADRGIYYMEKFQLRRAMDDLKRSISLSPNNSQAYANLGSAYYYSKDYLNALRNLKKAETLTRSKVSLLLIYVDSYFTYLSVGDFQNAELTCHKIKQLDDPGGYMAEMWILEIQGKNNEFLSVADKFIDEYPNNITALFNKAIALLYLGKTTEAEDCIRTWIKEYGPYTSLNGAHRFGLIYLRNGKNEEAMKYFDMQISSCKKSLTENDTYGQSNASYDLAGVYAVNGKLEEAKKWLREYEKSGFQAGLHEYIKYDPLFDNLRNDEEFKEIVKRANDKALAMKLEISEFDENN